MAITKFSELDTAIDNWLDRTDLTSRIPEFIAIAEDRMWYGDEDAEYGNEPLRVRPMETSTTLSIGGSGTASLPTGYLEARLMYMSAGGSNTEITYLPPTQFHQRAVTQGAGVPQFYTIEGENFIFGSARTGTPNLLYYARPDVLDSTDSESTNAILTSNRVIYLAGALLEANLYIQEFDQALIWARRFRSAIGGWNASSRRDRVGAGPLVARPVAVA